MFISVSVLVEIKKEYTINAEAGRVLGFLTDLKQVTACIPNLESVEVEASRFRGKIKPPFSFVKGRLGIESELVQPVGKDGFTATVKGSSIGASFQGTMRVTVLEGGRVTIDAKVETLGLLRTIPKSLIFKAVEDIEAPVLRCIKEKLEG